MGQIQVIRKYDQNEKKLLDNYESYKHTCGIFIKPNLQKSQKQAKDAFQPSNIVIDDLNLPQNEKLNKIINEELLDQFKNSLEYQFAQQECEKKLFEMKKRVDINVKLNRVHAAKDMIKNPDELKRAKINSLKKESKLQEMLKTKKAVQIFIEENQNNQPQKKQVEKQNSQKASTFQIFSTPSKSQTL